MKKAFLLVVLFFSSLIVFSQGKKDIYELYAINNLLTEEVKTVITRNISEKQTVFLGESVHYSGSDFLAKTEFIKYLVTEHGYKDIAFESDFFALLFDHNKQNLYSMWSKSKQCKELFEFLEHNNVTIWGFDNKLYSSYAYHHFTEKLSEILKENDKELSPEFKRLIKLMIKHQYNSREVMSLEEVDYLKKYTKELQTNEIIKTNEIWNQILKSVESAIELYTVEDNSSDKNRISIRDKQMAINLDFLVKTNPDKKFMVWLANAHMSKSSRAFMKGQTMGYQFRLLNPNSSYHIAFGAIRSIERNEKDIIKAHKKRNSILSLLPSVEKNYFLDASKMISNFISLRNKVFNDMFIFNLPKNKTAILHHFDALVFIAQGEEVSYEK